MENYSTLLGLAIAMCVVGGFALARRRQTRRFKKLLAAAQEAFSRHDYAAAERELRLCTKVAPLWTEGHTALGEALARQGKLDDAEVSYRLASDLRPRDALGHMDLGFFIVNYKPEESDRAIACFEKALVLNPELRHELMRDYRLTHLRDNPEFLRLLD